MSKKESSRENSGEARTGTPGRESAQKGDGPVGRTVRMEKEFCQKEDGRTIVYYHFPETGVENEGGDATGD